MEKNKSAKELLKDPVHRHRQICHLVKLLPKASVLAAKNGLEIHVHPAFGKLDLTLWRVTIRWESRVLVEWWPVTRVCRPAKGGEFQGFKLGEAVELAIRHKAGMLTPDG